MGGKTLIFHLIDKEMYASMRVTDQSLLVDRGMALHKMIRLATMATAADGYLNFMGNEFGHPEWVDFPREGNGWSYHYARRQWHLRDDQALKYHFLSAFDQAMLRLEEDAGIIGASLPRPFWLHDQDKVLAFGRGSVFFIFNFHPSQSLSDYQIEVPGGEYALALDTDESRFGGQSRIAAGQRYISEPVRAGNILRRCLRVYLPCRTALVLRSFAYAST